MGENNLKSEIVNRFPLGPPRETGVSGASYQSMLGGPTLPVKHQKDLRIREGGGATEIKPIHRPVQSLKSVSHCLSNTPVTAAHTRTISPLLPD